jgi:UDP-N-acetylglucosamine 4-epimerase
MTSFFDIKAALASSARERRVWLVTGAAGFIGSNLVEALLLAGERVRGLDNFLTGSLRNLEDVLAHVGPEAAERFEFVEADIRDRDAMANAMEGIAIVLHQAALGSVPRSIADPYASNDVNVTGFLVALDAARKAGVDRFVYAASSSTYGDDANQVKQEGRIGRPLSPYAVTKYVNELYAGVYARTFGLSTVGLRYFNVFGKRQDPHGPYAAVIPTWVSAMIADRAVTINGDGETSRDFCFIDNVVQANVLAAISSADVSGNVYNVAAGQSTSLNLLLESMRDVLAEHGIHYTRDAHYGPFRAGDVRHSLADISLANRDLGYRVSHDLQSGLAIAMPWYVSSLSS